METSDELIKVYDALCRAISAHEYPQYHARPKKKLTQHLKECKQHLQKMLTPAARSGVTNKVKI